MKKEWMLGVSLKKEVKVEAEGKVMREIGLDWSDVK